jgi:hypothetical protein
MYLMVRSALFLHVLLDYSFIAILSDGVRIVAACPKPSSPEHLFHLCMCAKYLPGGDTLDDLYDLLRWHHRHTLDEEMHVILIGSNLHEMDLMSFRNTHADLFEGILHCFREYLPPVLRRTYDMVEEERLVVSLEDMFAHSPILLHGSGHRDVYGKGIRAVELRGMF